MTFVFWLSYAALWALVVFLSLVLLGVVRTVYRLQRESPPAGGSPSLRDRPVPHFSAAGLAGETIDSGTFVGHPTALLFVGSDCDTCAITLHDLEALESKSDHNLVVVCQGPAEQCAELADVYRISAPVVADDDRRIADLFEVDFVPAAVIVDAHGQVASVGHPVGGEELEEMVAKARGEDELVVHHRGDEE